MLNLEDRFRSVLIAEHHVGIIVLRKIAVNLLQFENGIAGGLPLFVPHGHLRNQHPAHRSSATVVFHITGTNLGHEGHILLQLPDQVVAGILGRHASQMGDTFEHDLILHVLGIERHIAERRGKKVVVKSPHHHAFGQHRQLHAVFQRCALNAGDDGIRIHHAFIALGPHRRTEKRIGGRDRQLGVVRTAGHVHQVGATLHRDQIGIVEDGIQGNVAGIQAGFTLFFRLIIVFRFDERGGNLVQIARRHHKRQKQRRR